MILLLKLAVNLCCATPIPTVQYFFYQSTTVPTLVEKFIY